MVISSALSVKALFVTSEAFNETGTRQQRTVSTDLALSASIGFTSCFMRPTCYFYVDWLIYFQRIWESRCYCCQRRPSCPLKTQVFLNIASCFQTVIWCCEHPQPVELWYSLSGGGVTQWAGKWSELCLHRGIQLWPQSYRSPSAVPCEH